MGEPGKGKKYLDCVKSLHGTYNTYMGVHLQGGGGLWLYIG